MKQILIILFTLIVSTSEAQKIHWIIDSPNQQCREYFKRNFADIVNTALKETNVLSDFQDNAVNVKCNAEDIIIYCNIGGGDFEQVHNQLAVKNPKLILSFSAVCGNDISTSLSNNRGSLYIAPEQLECIREVFLKTCGVLIASGCNLSDICERFLEMLEDQEIELETLFNSGDGNFKAQLQECGSLPIANNNNHQIDDIPQNNPNTDMEQYFDLIVGSKKDAPHQDEIFTDDCMVFVLGQDGRTLIDRMTIDNYLLRITMSSILLRAIPVAKVMEDGKIKQLYVREYYKTR